MTDDQFLEALDHCTLPNLSHIDHIRATWLVLQRQPLLQALDSLRNQFRAYAAAKGHPEYYHETMTFAFVIAINERIQLGYSGSDLQQFLRLNPDLAEGVPFLHQWYTPSVLESDAARNCFLMPKARRPF